MDCLDCGCYAGSLPLCRIPIQASYGKDEVKAILSITKKPRVFMQLRLGTFYFSFLNGLLGYPFLECYWLLPNKRNAIRKFSGTTLKNDSSTFHLYSSICFWLIVTFFSVSIPVVVCQMGTRDPLLK